MDPVFFGALAFGGLFLLSRRSSAGDEDQDDGGESYGHHLVGMPGFRALGTEGVWPDRGNNRAWDAYEFTGKNGSFTVAMFADITGAFPVPGKTNVSFFYPDGTEARVVRAIGPNGSKWAEIDISGPHAYDLFVYHPANHPGRFPTEPVREGRFGAVSGWMGGRGPGAGTGLSPGDGGRQVANPYDWSNVTSSGGFHRFHNPDEDLVVPGEGASEDDDVSFGDDGRVEHEETGHVWSDSYGWVSPAEQASFGINILGLNIATSKEERLDRLQSKIDKAQEKLDALEEEAKGEGADIEKLSKQIASIQTQKERWEDKKNNLEVRMGEDPGVHDDDGDLDDLEDELDEDFGGLDEDDDLDEDDEDFDDLDEDDRLDDDLVD